MNADTFILIRKGVYRHDILGFRITLDEAIDRAIELLEEEDDSYHNIQIVKPLPDGEEIVATVVAGCVDPDVVIEQETLDRHRAALAELGVELPPDEALRWANRDRNGFAVYDLDRAVFYAVVHEGVPYSDRDEDVLGSYREPCLLRPTSTHLRKRFQKLADPK